MDNVYKQECLPLHTFACKLGDMSKKLSPIDIIPFQVTTDGSPILQKHYFTDSYLPLCGQNSVIGKSIMVNHHNSSVQPLACSNLFELKTDNQQNV